MESNKIASPQGTQGTQGAQGAQAAHGTRSRTGAHAQEPADAGSGGFLALLAALGTDDLAVDPLGETALAVEAAPEDPTGGQDAAFLEAWQGLLAPGAGVRADTTVQAQSAGVLDGAGGGANAVGALGASGTGGLAPGADIAFGANGAAQGIVAETALLDASGGARVGLGPAGASTTQGRAFSRLQTAMGQKADALETAAGRLASGSTPQSLGAQQAASGMLLANPAERMAGGGAGPGLSERASGVLASDTGAASPIATALAEGMASTSFAAGGRGADARSRPGEGRSDGAMGFDAAGLSAAAEGSAVEGAAMFADPAQAGLEDQVAEQVAYWVNQKTQNAELTLDRDGQPVEVSVTLSGNEAHVAFRSDQSATRELLDKSMAQLSELLRSEGLVLSGMSVGTSSGQREPSGESARQGQREGGRQARVEAAVPAGSGTLLRTGAPDRTVDVFV